MRYFIVKKLHPEPGGGLYFKYTKSGTGGMSRRDHVFTFDLSDAYCFADAGTAASYAGRLTEVMGAGFGIQAVRNGAD